LIIKEKFKSHKFNNVISDLESLTQNVK
jgi:hypothetical protein